jgi:hypothetical protein
MTPAVSVGQRRRWNDDIHPDSAGLEFRVTRAAQRGTAHYVYLTGHKKGRESWSSDSFIEKHSKSVPEPSPWATIEKVPVNPKDVKEGDTVTVEVTVGNRPKFTVTGEVYDSAGVLSIGGYSLHGRNVTVIDHTPAPPSEPEPKHGTFGTAFVNGEGTRRHGFIADTGAAGGGLHFVSPSSSGGYDVKHLNQVSGFEPTVTDFAKLQEVYDRVQDVADMAWHESDRDPHAGLKAVLEYLGLVW